MSTYKTTHFLWVPVTWFYGEIRKIISELSSNMDLLNKSWISNKVRDKSMIVSVFLHQKVCVDTH